MNGYDTLIWQIKTKQFNLSLGIIYRHIIWGVSFAIFQQMSFILYECEGLQFFLVDSSLYRLFIRNWSF